MVNETSCASYRRAAPQRARGAGRRVPEQLCFINHRTPAEKGEGEGEGEEHIDRAHERQEERLQRALLRQLSVERRALKRFLRMRFEEVLNS